MAIPLQIRSRNKLLVGLDYGTTYSGLCFVLSNAADFKDIKAWHKWPGGPSEHNEYLEKAPSRMAYASENSDLDQDAWGYEVDAGMTSYSWTKLLLDGSALKSEYDDPDLEKAAANGLMKLPQGKKAVDVVADYLKGMHRMFQQGMKDVGILAEDELTLPMPMEFWLTVPATWTEEAKWATRSAAIRAGWASRPGDEVNIITEPEAAMHLALKDSLNSVSDLIKVNSSVLVCDCGGGTVDLIAYVIEEIKPRLITKEACVGVGGKCGGTYIDRNLYKLFKERYGSAFTSLPPERTGPGSRFMQQFESKKKSFTRVPASRRPIKLELIMSELDNSSTETPGYDKRYHDITLTHQDMKDLFDPVVEKILELVSNQVAAVSRRGNPRVDTLILVGGLGGSPYVREAVSDWCREHSIRPTTPMGGGWSAIVRGATLRGLEGSIVDVKISRRHYGHTLGRKYDPDVDYNFDANKRQLWRDAFNNNQQMLSGFMYWEMKKDTEIYETTEIVSEFMLHHTEGQDMTTEHKLYACSLDDPPDTIESDRVELLGTIKGSYADADLSKFQSEYQDSRRVYRISLTLSIALSKKNGLLNCKLLLRGREIGKTTIDFSYK
ncbi:hsp70-like protein [Clohesyomyces aquaticus]|uniref:Hsp70-like protein n=1 Tax=Clohesyomyces aquaticus TaxID=1231657 RepID=A0A1Y2A5W5_9PLEO|nr:hsp70-like protein [Clohesyomyces aquaticus]